MNTKSITDNWVKRNKGIFISDLKNGYKKDRYTDKDILSVLKGFDESISPYFIGRSLYLSSIEYVLPIYKRMGFDQERIKKELSQIQRFCRLGEYGMGYLPEFSFEDITIELMG